jgi:aspartate-semialdehyde dehydrogenase
LQAASGAGSDGPRALDLLDNVVPYIAGEEEKFEPELCKILGEPREGVVAPATIRVSAHCHRVPTLDGHLEAVSLELERTATPEAAVEVLEEFRGRVAELTLPSAPERPLAVRREADRPQPRLDRDAGDGMTVVVGRVRSCPVLGLKLVLLSHNTVRGAAGGTLLNAELLAAKRLLPGRSSR